MRVIVSYLINLFIILIESPTLTAGTKTESWRSSGAECVWQDQIKEEETEREVDEESYSPVTENKSFLLHSFIPELYIQRRGKDQHLYSSYYIIKQRKSVSLVSEQ